MELTEATFHLDLADDAPDDDPLEAYERLLLDVLEGGPDVLHPCRRGRPALAGHPAAARRPTGDPSLRAGVVGPAGGSRPASPTAGDWAATHDPHGAPTARAGVPADRRPRHHRRPAHLRARRRRRDHRLVLRRPVRLAQRVRQHPRPRCRVWRISVIDGTTRTSQFYLPDSAILVTRFLTEDGVAEVHDFFPLVRAHEPHHLQRIMRRVTAVRGRVRVRMDLTPRPDYGRVTPEFATVDGAILITGGGPAPRSHRQRSTSTSTTAPSPPT